MSNNKIIHCLLGNQLGHSVNTYENLTYWFFFLLEITSLSPCSDKYNDQACSEPGSIRQIKFLVPELLHKLIVITLSISIASKSLLL